MARTKTTLGDGIRLSDYLSASLLARVYPPELVHQLLDLHGVNSKRQRSVTALVTTYYCMALSLYPEAAYEAVFSVVTAGLAWLGRRVNLLAQTLPSHRFLCCAARLVLSQLVPGTGSREQRRSQAVTVRVIDYELANAQGEMTAYSLVTGNIGVRSQYCSFN